MCSSRPLAFLIEGGELTPWIRRPPLAGSLRFEFEIVILYVYEGVILSHGSDAGHLQGTLRF